MCLGCTGCASYFSSPAYRYFILADQPCRLNLIYHRDLLVRRRDKTICTPCVHGEQLLCYCKADQLGAEEEIEEQAELFVKMMMRG